MRMSRVATTLAAALSLWASAIPPIWVGLTPAVLIGINVFSVRDANAQSESAVDWFDLGLEKAKRGDLQGAIADWTKAIEMYPQYAYAYYNRGRARRELGDLQKAIADYTKAVEINPNYAWAFYNRGNIRDE